MVLSYKGLLKKPEGSNHFSMSLQGVAIRTDMKDVSPNGSSLEGHGKNGLNPQVFFKKVLYMKAPLLHPNASSNGCKMVQLFFLAILDIGLEGKKMDKI